MLGCVENEEMAAFAANFVLNRREIRRG